jgi:hypothetical protein
MALETRDERDGTTRGCAETSRNQQRCDERRNG